MRGQLDHRQVEDVGDNALSYSEVKALASGDPLILDKAQADSEHARLSRLQRAWQRNLQNLRTTLANSTGLADSLQADQTTIVEALARVRPIAGDAFQMEIDGRTVDRRADAAALIARFAQAIDVHSRQPVTLGRLAGLELAATVRRDLTDGELTLQVALHGMRRARRAATPSRPYRRQLNRATARAPRPRPPRRPRPHRRPRTRSPRAGSRRPPRAHTAIQVRPRAARRRQPVRGDRRRNDRTATRRPGRHVAGGHAGPAGWRGG